MWRQSQCVNRTFSIRLFSLSVLLAGLVALGVAACVVPAPRNPAVVVTFASYSSEAEPVEVAAEFLRPLGTVLSLGRLFIASDFARGLPKAAIVSFDLWRSAFDSRRDIIGGKISVAGEEYLVVAVAPPNVRELAGRRVWLAGQS